MKTAFGASFSIFSGVDKNNFLSGVINTFSLLL